MDGDDTFDRRARRIHDDELRGVAERRMDRRELDVAEVLRPIDAVLADVVDAGLTAVGLRRNARRLHRTGAHQRAAAARRLADAELARRVDRDADAPGIDAELFHRDLQRDGVDALAHLGPAVHHQHRAVVLEADQAAGDLLEAVAEARVLEPEPEPDGSPGGDGGVIGRLDLVEAALGTEAAVVHDLARSPHLAGADDVALADLPTVDADPLGETVEHALHRELRLVGTEAPERAAHRVVGPRRDRLDVDRR